MSCPCCALGRPQEKGLPRRQAKPPPWSWSGGERSRFAYWRVTTFRGPVRVLETAKARPDKIKATPAAKVRLNASPKRNDAAAAIRGEGVALGEASWWLRILPRAASLHCSRKRDWTWSGDTILSMRSALRIIPNCEHSGVAYQARSGNSPRISNPPLSTPVPERFGSSRATVNSAAGMQEDAKASALASSVQATRPLVSSSACRSNSRR